MNSIVGIVNFLKLLPIIFSSESSIMNAPQETSLFQSKVYQSCIARIDQIHPDTSPKWGKMTPAQMFSHCAEVQEVLNGKELKNTPFIAKLFKGMIRKMVVGEKDYPKNSQTHPQYKQRETKNFEEEKSRLLAAIGEFVKEETEGQHTLFGVMTAEERGWAAYKHLNHHLIQFGV